MQPVRVAIIGCGFIAEKHVRSLSELRGKAELAAICDIDERRLAAFKEKAVMSSNPDVSLHSDIAECLRRDDVELVVIATGSDTHADMTLAALKAGKHVLVEKPLALSLRDARRAASESKRSGRILAVSLQSRYLPQAQALKKAADEGRFGKLVHGVVSMRWNRGMDYYSASPWRDSWAKGGGLFINQCIHYIDLLQWVMGPVVSVYGEAGTFHQPLSVENMGTAVIKFANGAIGLIEASSCVYPKSLQTSIGVFGEKGSVVLEGGKLEEVRTWLFEQKDGGDTPFKAAEISHTPLYEDLLNAIRTGASPLVSVETALHSLEVVMAVYQSVREHRPVSLPLHDFDMSQFKQER